jgi:hypothetical protein
LDRQDLETKLVQARCRINAGGLGWIAASSGLARPATVGLVLLRLGEDF